MTSQAYIMRALLIQFFIVVLLLTVCIDASLFSGVRRLFKMKGDAPRSLLPLLPPHEDTCFMVQFVSDRSDDCTRMEPIVQGVEEELNVKFRKINISKKPQAYGEMYDCVGGNECGNVPFFYNRKTGQAICGATPYNNLKKLVLGEFTSFILPLEKEVMSKAVRQRDTFDFLKERIKRSQTKDT